MIPRAGMGAIPQQLHSKLKQSQLRLNTKVERISGNEIMLTDGEKLPTDFIIIATNPSGILPNYVSSLTWKSCENLYFTVNQRSIQDPVIGLNTDEKRLTNNIFYPTSISSESRGKDELLSVTVVKQHNLTEQELIKKVLQELDEDFGISKASFLKRYTILEALPIVEDLQNSRDANEHLLTEHIALAD